jgi:hypothetical protein
LGGQLAPPGLQLGAVNVFPAEQGAKLTIAISGVEVRRLFHKLRSQAIEPFNGLFKNIFEWGGQMPVKGLQRCQLLGLGAILLYQLVLLYQHEHQLPIGIEIKALLRAA